jgi:hypothetical protein
LSLTKARFPSPKMSRHHLTRISIFWKIPITLCQCPFHRHLVFLLQVFQWAPGFRPTTGLP